MIYMTESDKYQNGKIYKIVDCGYNKCYIGSTCNTLAKRISWHRSDYQKYKNGKSKSAKAFDIFDEYGVNNCKIELIERYPCASKDELLKREGYHIQSNECVNRMVAGRSRTEYYIQNKEDVLSKMKYYYVNNKDDVLTKVKNYYINNKDEVLTKMKNYYLQNKEDILSKSSIKITCSYCGCSCRKNNITNHNRSKRHLRALANSNSDSSSSHSSASSVSDPSHAQPNSPDDQAGSQV